MDLTTPAATPTAAPVVAADHLSTPTSFYVFEFACLFVFVVSLAALRARRGYLLQRQQQRYQRLAQYSASMGGSGGSVAASTSGAAAGSQSTGTGAEGGAVRRSPGASVSHPATPGNSAATLWSREASAADFASGSGGVGDAATTGGGRQPRARGVVVGGGTA